MPRPSGSRPITRHRRPSQADPSRASFARPHPFNLAITRAAVLNLIKAEAPISRKEVSHRSGLSAATITGITADLMDDGLVFEKAQGDSRKGRPPILLALNPRGGYVVGLKLTENHVIGALTDLEATVLAKRTG